MFIDLTWKRAPLPLILVVSAVASGGLGCAEPVESAPDARLRAGFPEQAALVLSGGDALVASAAGFHREAGAGILRGLDVALPADGAGVVRIQVPGSGEIRVREAGNLGVGRLSERAVGYQRAGGTSFWTVVPGGAEEWLHLEAGAAAGEGAVASWAIEGAVVRQQGEAIELVDERGVVSVRVTAPAAYAAGGRAIAAHLSARGSTIELRIDPTMDEVLIDPLWTATASMATARAGHSAAVLGNGKILVAGGFDGSFIRRAYAETYDPAANVWTTVASLATARSGHSATTLSNGKVLVAGGYTGLVELTSTEIYDPATGTWSAGPSLAVSRNGHTATTLTNGKVLVAGGYNSAGYVGSAELYDVATNSWSSAGNLVIARSTHTATLLADGRVLITGGASGVNLRTAEIYDPATNTWTAAALMNGYRSSHMAARLPDGKVLVAGGFSGGWGGPSYLSSAELYDPVANTWTLTGSMSAPRESNTATALSSGLVLVAGDDTSANPSSAELYDPATGAWSTGGTMTAARQLHTATLLPGDEVLVVGGLAATPLASAERFSSKLNLGSACGAAGDCLSGFCVDGVCCNEACSGGTADCQACSVAAGAPTNGTCAPTPGVNGCTTTCVSIQRGVAGAVTDTYLASPSPNKNFGTAATVSQGSVTGGERRGLVRFDLSSIPANALITTATATVTTSSGATTLRAHRATASWAETTVTWNNFGGAYGAAVDGSLAPSGTVMTGDLTALTRSWVNGSVPNYGVLLERDLTGTTAFHSSDQATVSRRPKLDVCYVH